MINCAYVIQSHGEAHPFHKHIQQTNSGHTTWSRIITDWTKNNIFRFNMQSVFLLYIFCCHSRYIFKALFILPRLHHIAPLAYQWSRVRYTSPAPPLRVPKRDTKNVEVKIINVDGTVAPHYLIYSCRQNYSYPIGNNSFYIRHL